MKKLSQTAFAFLVGMQLIFAQSNVFYTVQIGTFLNAKKTEFSEIKSLGFIYANPGDNNLAEVYIGGFNNSKDANKVVEDLVDRGYANAFAQERFLGEGREVAVIQIATRNLKQDLDWESFLTAGELYIQPLAKQVKVIAGIYDDLNQAKARLPEIKKLGFKDAFIKKINSAYLHKVGDFELGSTKRPLIPLNFDRNPTASAGNGARQSRRPTEYSYTAVQPNFTPRSPASSAVLKPKDTSPKIRAKIKRGSVLELQKLLKTQQMYSGSLDGYYGNNTAKGYDQLKKTNRTLQKYQLMAKYLPDQQTTAGAQVPLQNLINTLNSNTRGLIELERYNAPVSNAYRGYLMFYNYGPSVEVNQLLNAAIRGAYPNNQIGGLSPVDPNATYSYNDMDQVILHLLYVHSANKSQYNVPCWLFAIHPEQTARANTILTNFPGFQYTTQQCDQFSTWEEIKVLKAIAEDLNDQQQLNKNRLALDAAARNDLFLANQPLVTSEQRALEDWHNSLWQGLQGWASTDPLHQNIINAMRASYFQSLILLEDFYMDKGLKQKDAQGLALAALHTVVGYHLERFL